MERTKHHSLNDILIITILAVICGANGFAQIALFGRSKLKWLMTFLELPNGIPSHDTFGRVLAALDSAQFERWVTQWTANLAKRTQGRVLAIYGKTLRRSFQSASGGGKTSTERRYYISSMPGDDAKQMLAAGRDHWGVENKVHWCLDVAFREDECRIRTGHGAENFARLRRLSINPLKAETTTKVGLASKRLRYGWDHDYLLTVLAGTKIEMRLPC